MANYIHIFSLSSVSKITNKTMSLIKLFPIVYIKDHTFTIKVPLTLYFKVYSIVVFNVKKKYIVDININNTILLKLNFQISEIACSPARLIIY